MNTDYFPRCVLATFLAACAVCAAAAGANEPADPREQFRALGVEDSYFDRLSDGGPITPREWETMLRIMYRLRIIPPVNLDRWAMDAELLEAAIQRPEDYRGLIFHLRGRVTEVEPFRPPDEAAERYELEKYYRCRLKLDAPERTVLVYTETVPEQWQKGARPDASGGAPGVFLKLVKRGAGATGGSSASANGAGATGGSSASAGTTPIFVAPRLAWYPNDLLGRLGMDVGLLDTVHNREPLKKDRRAFYEMLAAVGRAKPGQLLRQAEENLPNIPQEWRWTNSEGQELYSVVPLFNEPEGQLGRLVALQGTARLVEEIYLDKDDADIVDQYGINHYYQVSLFTDDSQGYPLTFCVRELPEGMPYGNSSGYGESVLVAGFFFKTWPYPISRLAEGAISPGDPKTRLQLSPLLIGRSLVWRPPPRPADQTRTNVIVGGLFIAAIVLVWIVAWRSMHRERRWVDQVIGGPPKDFPPPEKD